MADRNIASECRRGALIGMKYRSVLDVASISDRDQFGVTADHYAEPDTGLISNNNRTDDRRVFGDIPILALKRYLSFAE